MVHQHITSIEPVAAPLEDMSTDFQRKDVLTVGRLLPISAHTSIIDLIGKPHTMMSIGLRANQVSMFSIALNC